MWKNILLLILVGGCVHLAITVSHGERKGHDEPKSIVLFSAPMGSEPIEPIRQFNDDGTRSMSNDKGW